MPPNKNTCFTVLLGFFLDSWFCVTIFQESVIECCLFFSAAFIILFSLLQGKIIKGVYRFHAVITTFEMILADCPELRSIPWRCVVIDEAHRLKNRNCKLLEGLKMMDMVNRHRFCSTAEGEVHRVRKEESFLINPVFFLCYCNLSSHLFRIPSPVESSCF